MLTGRPDLQSARLREEGYRKAMAAAGVAPDEALIRLGAYTAAPVGRAGAATCSPATRRRRPCSRRTTSSAIATIEVARELGLSVPGDLSVVGFDNIPESALCTPPLTTVEQPIRTMGHHAIEMLIRLIRDDPPDDDAHHARHEPRRAPVDRSPVTVQGTPTAEAWRDPAVAAADRVADLIGRMTLREKIAQLAGIWVGMDTAGSDLAPHQHEFAAAPARVERADPGRHRPAHPAPSARRRSTPPTARAASPGASAT